jgi:V/A-type H+-transporting ATPase subunit I
VHTIWFELLTTHEDLTDTLEALARTGCIELELHRQTREEMSLQDLQVRLQKYTRLERYYRPLWPQPDTGLSPFSGSPAEILDKALNCLYDWEKLALPKVQRLEIVKSRLTNLLLLDDLLGSDEADRFDYQLLSAAGPTLVARLFLLPAPAPDKPEDIPETILWNRFSTPNHEYMLLVGEAGDLDDLDAELMMKKYTRIPIPSLPPSREEALHVVSVNRSKLAAYEQRLQKQIDDLAKPYHLPQALGEINRMKWFLNNVASLPASTNFAWITGWTSDTDGNELRRALRLHGSRAILHFTDSPEQVQPPLVLKNPWWARPFEFFPRLLGTPGREEADPSRLLAVMVPLMFGYMFGDVGQGLVLLLVGVLWQKRWPLLRILIVNGASAMVFGFVFGSFFGREDLIPALWLHPVADPLPVLAVPLATGVLIIFLGLALNALEANWRGEWLRWLHVDAPVVVLYTSILSLFFLPLSVSVKIMISALTWYLIGNLLLAEGKILPVLVAVGTLIETLIQLVLNTLSFVRIGAFALAHAGLSMAFNIMADSTDSVVIALMVLLLGNVIVIVLEGLVVSIQTTRLVLFEFFIRFLQASGRTFKPLSGPEIRAVNS